MPRRVSPSQIKSKLRQAESQIRGAVNDYNNSVRQYNANVRKAQRAIDSYNREVQAHNARVRANQRRLQAEIARLNSQRSSVRYTVTTTSALSLHTAYRRVEDAADAAPWDDRGQVLVDLAEAEAANSAHVANTFLGAAVGEEELEDTSLTNELNTLSQDLDHRWRGALYALNPRNPDAARHFCTSAREIILRMIDMKAPDDAVLAAKPNCHQVTGKPARRDKIGYLLERYGANHESLGDFIDADVDDVMNLFGVFNKGTHGEAGQFDITALWALKSRVEGAVRFLSTVIRGI
jgi:hypothetical protein